MKNEDTNRVAPLVHTDRYFLTAGETNIRGEMPVTLLAERMIEVATNHANRLGIGYDTLSPQGKGWVLSRLAVEMPRIPKINQHYNVVTWIESWTRMFSERCFRFEDENGCVYGYGRSVWAVIDVESRRAADLNSIGSEALIASGEDCPMPRIATHRPVVPTIAETLTFRFTDFDFNRHVNSVRYIEHILNMWPVDHYSRYRTERFEIAYRHECVAGDTVELRADMSKVDAGTVDIVRGTERAVTSSLRFVSDPVEF